MNKIFTSIYGTSSLAIMLAATPAFAQSASDNESAARPSEGLSEIIVTARRKEESLIDVPVAVTAVNSEVLARANVTSLESAAAIVPFVTIARVTSGNGGFMSIRGIASTPQDAGAQQSVLTNIDYVLVGRGRMATMAMFDIAQIEVLKGPQALYFGKNTTAGVVSITSRDPGQDFGGTVKAGYEFEANQRYLDAAVDVPLTDALRMRLAGHYSKMRGWLKNNAQPINYPVGSAFQPWINAGVTTAPGTTAKWGPADEEIAGRVTMVFEPNSDLTAKLKYTYGQTSSNGTGGSELYVPYCVNTDKLISYGLVDPYSDCANDFQQSQGDFPAALAVNTELLRNGVRYARTTGHLASLNIDYRLSDHLTLASITGYYNVGYQASSNNSPTAYAGIFTGTRDRAHGFSQELRLASEFDAPVNFEIGGYFDKLHQDTFGNAIVIPGPVRPESGNFLDYKRLTDSDSKSASLFAKLNWAIIDTLTLSGGVRYTKYDLDSVDGNAFVGSTSPLFAILRPQGDYFIRSYSDANYSPEMTLSYRPNRFHNLYISYKTGYKSGGFSYPSVLQKIYTEQNTTFKPEEAKSIELGYKAELLDRRLRIDFAAYRTTVANQQLSGFDAGALAFFISNAGKSRVQGFELQATGAVADGLQVFGAVGYNDGKYVSYPNAQCVQGSPSGCTQDLSGRVLPRAPKWAGNFGANYYISLGSNLELSLNGLGTFSSSYYAIDSLDPNTIQNSYIRWDAGVAIGADDGTWKLALQGRNLSNKFIQVYAYDASRFAPGTYNAVPQRGRQISLEASFNF